jgi:phosphomannomutase
MAPKRQVLAARVDQIGGRPVKSAPMAAETTYRCPGETYEISRSVHLGRLAGFYPACAECPHREDTGTFSARRTKLLASVHRHAKKPDSLFDQEGIAGVYLNEICPEIARRVGQAFGGITFESWTAKEPPRVFIASDGRPATAELAAAATDGLRWAGCEAVDLGPATAPCLAMAAAHHDAAGTIMVGNVRGSLREVSLTFGGRGGEPISSPGALDTVAETFHSHPPRPARPFGRIERLAIEADYLNELRPCFHALRPLKLVIDTTSPALLRYLESLTGSVTITMERATTGSFDLGRLGARVRTAKAHFGIWIDGDGEACRVTDEHGEPISAESLAGLVICAASDGRSAEQVLSAGDHDNRESVRKAMLESRAEFAADRRGRIWFGDCPAADALKTLTHLLALLSRDDRPLSERVASAILGGCSAPRRKRRG